MIFITILNFRSDFVLHTVIKCQNHNGSPNVFCFLFAKYNLFSFLHVKYDRSSSWCCVSVELIRVLTSSWFSVVLMSLLWIHQQQAVCESSRWRYRLVLTCASEHFIISHMDLWEAIFSIITSSRLETLHEFVS